MKNFTISFDLGLTQVHMLVDELVVKHQLTFRCGCRMSTIPSLIQRVPPQRIPVRYWCNLHWPTHVEVTK
jgi:hypothetical protein